MHDLQIYMTRNYDTTILTLRFVQAMLESAGIKNMLNELSSTVVFERPTEEPFIRKWQLACEGG